MDEPSDPLALRIAGRLCGSAIVLGAIALAWYVARVEYREPCTDDAVVRANLVGIAPQVSGPISELHVVDNQQVAQGELLFAIEPKPFQVALDRAQAERLMTQSQIDAAKAAVAAAEAQVQQMQANKKYAEEHVKRLEPLLAGHTVSADEVDQAREKLQAAQAELAGAQEDLARQQSLVGQFGDVNAQLAAARAAVERAQLDLDFCRVTAPFPARVVNLNLSAGEYASAGRQVFALVDLRAWYVLANFQETYLASIRAGMEVEVFLLSYPGRRFRGKVEGVAWATSPEDGVDDLGLARVQSTLNWVRLASRMPVRIRLEDPEPDIPFRMGMSAVVTVRGGAQRPETGSSAAQ